MAFYICPRTGVVAWLALHRAGLSEFYGLLPLDGEPHRTAAATLMDSALSTLPLWEATNSYVSIESHAAICYNCTFLNHRLIVSLHCYSQRDPW